jgi:hypothetical protein
MRCAAPILLRLKVDALRRQAAMIDARIDVEFGKAGVDVIGPALAPLLDILMVVPVADLLAETFRHLAHGEHDMGMGLGLPPPNVPMHIEVGDHAAIDKLGLHEIAGQLDALALLISRGMANSTSRASCASLRFSNASTSFQRRSRSATLRARSPAT